MKRKSDALLKFSYVYGEDFREDRSSGIGSTIGKAALGLGAVAGGLGAGTLYLGGKALKKATAGTIVGLDKMFGKH